MVAALRFPVSPKIKSIRLALPLIILYGIDITLFVMIRNNPFFF